MHSELSFSSSRRRVSVATSVLVHAAVIGVVILLGGPVWEAAVPARRKLAMMVAPRPEPLALRLPLPGRTPALVQSPATPLPALPIAATRLPVTKARPVLRIAEAPEIAIAAPVLAPALAMPALAVKPAVEVGSLEGSKSLPNSARRVVSGAAGFDLAEASAKGQRRVAAEGFGFEGGEAKPPGRGPSKWTASAGFDEAEAPTARGAVPKAVNAAFEGLEILDKPRPVYTEEARRLRIEGTVQLRVVFGAAGQIRVVGVVKGLGYGLDEAAVQAAEAIRYRPARRDGRPVDAPAVIQIRFQIA